MIFTRKTLLIFVYLQNYLLPLFFYIYKIVFTYTFYEIFIFYNIERPSIIIYAFLLFFSIILVTNVAIWKSQYLNNGAYVGSLLMLCFWIAIFIYLCILLAEPGGFF